MSLSLLSSKSYEPGLRATEVYVFCAEMQKTGDVSDLAIHNFVLYGLHRLIMAAHIEEQELLNTWQKDQMTDRQYQHDKHQLHLKVANATKLMTEQALPNYGYACMWELCTDNGTTPLDYTCETNYHIADSASNGSSFIQEWRFSNIAYMLEHKCSISTSGF